VVLIRLWLHWSKLLTRAPVHRSSELYDLANNIPPHSSGVDAPKRSPAGDEGVHQPHSWHTNAKIAANKAVKGSSRVLQKLFTKTVSEKGYRDPAMRGLTTSD
jgi:hypothetical protein